MGDADDATGASLTLAAASSNPALATIALGGSGTNRTITVTPVAGQTGQTTITLTVDDGKGATAQDTFVLTVSSLQVAPTNISLSSSATTATTYGQSITYTSTVTGSKGTPTGTVTFYDGNFALGAAAALDATGKATLATTTTPAGTRSDQGGLQRRFKVHEHARRRRLRRQ